MAKFVRAGDLIRIGPWNMMMATIRAMRLIAGPNVRLRVLPTGTYITFDGFGSFWNHPFKARMQGDTAATFEPAMVNTQPVTIGKVPLDGGKTGNVPTLKFEKSLILDADGRGFFAVEVTCDELWGVLTAEMVQVADLVTSDGKARPGGSQRAGAPYLGGVPSVEGPGRRARHPTTVIRRRADGTIATWPATQHNLTHRAKFDSPNPTAVRHIFLPA